MASPRSSARGFLLRVYRRMPTLGRRWAVRTVAPSYTVGAMCFLERSDGALLLVRHTYRHRWGVPGGLLQRREAPEDGVRREVAEEVGLDVELIGEPAVVVDPVPQRVDIVFRARLASGCSPDSVLIGADEIAEARWFPAGELPELQHETAGALVALARSSRAPQAPSLAPLPADAERPERADSA